MSKESETPSGIRLMLLLKEHLREIMNRECANQASIHLYCTGSYPFPVVMVSVTDRSLRLYERKHIAKQNGADYKLLTVPELSAPAYQAWHTREVKGLPALN